VSGDPRLIYRPDGPLDRADFVETSLVRGRRLVRYLLRVLRGTGGVIAGGFPRWCCSPLPDPAGFRDVDVFCSDDATLQRVRCALLAFGHALVRENRVSFVHAGRWRLFGLSVPPVNVIKPVDEGRVQTRGDLAEVLHNFDFTICKAGILDETRGLVHVAFRADEKARRLRFTRIHTPMTGIVRAIKYSRKGYKISLRELMRVFAFWDEQKVGFRKKVKKILHVRAGADLFPLVDLHEVRRDEDRTRFDHEVDVDQDVAELEEAYSLLMVGSRRGR
jgi:hypothetical protein